MTFQKLNGGDYEDAIEFALRAPEMNVVLLSNMTSFGMEQGDSPFNADYVGNRGEKGFEAIGALYNIGAYFFRASGTRAMRGMADCVAGLGRLPAYTAGTREHVEVFLEELGDRAGSPTLVESSYMVLKGETSRAAGAAVVRAAVAGDVDEMVRLQMDFELEAFGKSVIDGEELRKLLSHQVHDGAAMVVEEEGRIVSKAEATIARPYAALVGGVYTVPEARSRGLSTTCVSALCDCVLGQVGAVGLNVFVDNHAARRVYIKTGFEVVEDWLTVEMA
ncbi:MAG: GNAT family N-acetyltransferase [Candidatus Geothermincolia bacterium]